MEQHFDFRLNRCRRNAFHFVVRRKTRQAENIIAAKLILFSSYNSDVLSFNLPWGLKVVTVRKKYFRLRFFLRRS